MIKRLISTMFNNSQDVFRFKPVVHGSNPADHFTHGSKTFKKNRRKELKKRNKR